MQELPQILYCHCAFAQVISQGVKQKVLEQLTAAGVDFEAVPRPRVKCPHAGTPPLTRGIAKREANLQASPPVIPGQSKGLFQAAECPLPENGPEIINMRVLSGEEAASALLGQTQTASSTLAEEVTV